MMTEEALPADAFASCAEVEVPRVTAGGVRQSIWLLLVSWVMVGVLNFALLGGTKHLILGAYQLIAFLFTAVVFVRLKGQGLRSSLRLHWVGGRLLVFGAMVGCGASALSTLVLWQAEPWIGPMPEVILRMMPETWNDYLLMLLVGCLGAGVCEEVFFRGVIQGLLTRRGRWPAIFITAILFGVMHLNLFQFIGGLIMGIALGWVVERSGSLLPAVVMHMTANGLSLTWFFSLGLANPQAPWWLLAGMGGVGVIGMMGFLVFTAGRPQAESSLKLTPLRVSKKAWLAVVLPLFLLGGLIGGGTVGAWHVTPIGFDVPALGIRYGDHVLSLHARWFPVAIQPGDGILFTKEDRLCLGVVKDVEGAGLTVNVQGTELSISRDDVEGKIVEKLRLPWWEPAQ